MEGYPAMNLVEYPDREMMMIDVANQLAGQINEALMTHDRVTFAVPGGTTPGPVFDVLCAAQLDWANVLVLPTDERWVPLSSDASNARLIRRHLLTGHAAKAGFLSLYMDGKEPEEAAPELDAQLAGRLPISVLLLGMGADMHTASLFPGAAGLMAAMHRHAGGPVFAPIKVPGSGPEGTRMTLTAPVLEDALSKHVLITGAGKRRALDEARRLDDPLLAPICAVLDGATVHWAE